MEDSPLFAVEESALGSHGKSSFPDFPGEKPSKLALERWCDTWYEDLSAIGYSAVLRGEDPFELKKLAPRPLLTVPANAAAAASVEAKNADITHSNDTNKKEYDARPSRDQESSRTEAEACTPSERRSQVEEAAFVLQSILL